MPWQRQLDQPRDRDQALGVHRPVGKVRSSSGVHTEGNDGTGKTESQAGLGSNAELSALYDPRPSANLSEPQFAPL